VAMLNTSLPTQISLQDINHIYIIPSLFLKDEDNFRAGNADPIINAREMKKALGKN
jgi:hypothetical protein